MVQPGEHEPQRRRESGIDTGQSDRIEQERAAEPLAGRDGAHGTIMGDDAAARDPDTGAAGTTNPRSAAPFGSQKPVGIVPPKRGEAKWLAIVGAGVVGIILILIALT